MTSLSLELSAAVNFRIFTKRELSEKDLDTTTFSMTFVARGYSGKTVRIWTAASNPRAKRL